MEKLKHTPGPWTIEEHGNGYALYSGRNGNQHGLNLINLIEPDMNFKANAKLIAAAPQLLEACRMAMVEIQNGAADDLTINALQDAIDKATI